jgi:hypothetical protein
MLFAPLLRRAGIGAALCCSTHCTRLSFVRSENTKYETRVSGENGSKIDLEC